MLSGFSILSGMKYFAVYSENFEVCHKTIGSRVMP